MAILPSHMAVTLGGSRKRRLGGVWVAAAQKAAPLSGIAKRGRDAAARLSPEEEEEMHGASPSRGGNAAQLQRRSER